MTPDPITSEQVRALLARASRARCGHVGRARFGPLPVSVHSSDAMMAEHAVRHSTGDPTMAPWPEITVHLVDASVIPADHLPVGLLPRPEGDANGSWVFIDGDCIATTSSSMVWLADRSARQALRWTATPADVPVWEAPRPLRFALRWATAMHGSALLHCAAVAGPRGALLLVGRGGTGKSTTSFACSGKGLRLLGDDYCIVDPVGAEPTVYATYVLGTLDDNSLAMLPHLRSRVIGDAPKGKRVVTLDAVDDSPSAPVVAACTVVRAPGETTRFVPVSRMTVLRALAPSTQVQIPGFAEETFAATSAVVRRIDTYELRVGALQDVPGVVGDLVGTW